MTIHPQEIKLVETTDAGIHQPTQECLRLYRWALHFKGSQPIMDTIVAQYRRQGGSMQVLALRLDRKGEALNG